uniref:SGNH domain-containing protein n=1 Tax=Amphora coffeiformis TaxID=265554 RepID=A0A7S3P3Q0_9STRA|mmetsp:Transcript_10293/g.19751  ORF Transcript_10293/g.19751 Transcript_10293/m.19751 type:complete len:394 (+) Transcript_10293:143-1324(+)
MKRSTSALISAIPSDRRARLRCGILLTIASGFMLLNISNQKTPAESVTESWRNTAQVVKLYDIEPADKEVTQSNLRNNSSEKNIPSDDGLLDYFNYCTADYLGDAESEQEGFPIWYQCEGPHYDEFTEKLHQFVDQKSTKSPEWGHREAAIPANKSVLFFGNSHTRQLGLSLACQMGADQVVDVHHFEFDLIDPNMALRFRFRNGASVYIVANSYVAYSHQWQELLERQIQKPIAEFDLVVMGIFNVAKGASSFLDNLLHLASTLPKEYDLDLATQPPGPSPQNVTAVYDGPFLLVSNYSVNQKQVYDQYRKILRESPRSDHAFLYQRHYCLKMGLEGAAASKDDRLDMLTDDYGRANRMHRCVGKGGGFPDLVAWDVTEFIYEHTLESKISG